MVDLRTENWHLRCDEEHELNLQLEKRITLLEEQMNYILAKMREYEAK